MSAILGSTPGILCHGPVRHEAIPPHRQCARLRRLRPHRRFAVEVAVRARTAPSFSRRPHHLGRRPRDQCLRRRHGGPRRRPDRRDHRKRRHRAHADRVPARPARRHARRPPVRAGHRYPAHLLDQPVAVAHSPRYFRFAGGAVFAVEPEAAQGLRVPENHATPASRPSRAGEREEFPDPEGARSRSRRRGASGGGKAASRRPPLRRHRARLRRAAKMLAARQLHRTRPPPSNFGTDAGVLPRSEGDGLAGRDCECRPRGPVPAAGRTHPQGLRVFAAPHHRSGFKADGGGFERLRRRPYVGGRRRADRHSLRPDGARQIPADDGQPGHGPRPRLSAARCA